MEQSLLMHFPMGTAGDLGLSKEVAAILPMDPYEQLKLAHQICCFAFSQKVGTLEADNRHHKQGLAQRMSTIKTLESRVTSLQLDLQDSQSQAQQMQEEAGRLSQEKAALLTTVQSLKADNDRLRAFKRKLLHSLQNDSERGDSFLADEEWAMATSSPVAHRGPSSVPFSQALPALTSGPAAASMGWASGSPAHAAGMQRQPSQTPTTIDGREFFRLARSRLAAPRFGQFLQAIKELNSGAKTREQTLQQARDLFGTSEADLYASFEELLNQHLPPHK
ncbi:hypothetical protein WJX84_001744 [Apatococcus fuscideae]|uniref:At4g15545-like C-terminal domain-containing protein n=1 Tax=Apatococcus fuscideae TaxID=2026836 RepID=A0AAW1TF68_9CHLO